MSGTDEVWVMLQNGAYRQIFDHRGEPFTSTQSARSHVEDEVWVATNWGHLLTREVAELFTVPHEQAVNMRPEYPFESGLLRGDYGD